jgi:hypothetical protein
MHLAAYRTSNLEISFGICSRRLIQDKGHRQILRKIKPEELSRCMGSVQLSWPN